MTDTPRTMTTIASVSRRVAWSGAGRAVAATVVLGLAAVFGQLPVGAAEPAVAIPAPAADAPAPAGDGMQTVVLAGGCFWGIQAVYQHSRACRTRCRAMPAAPAPTRPTSR